MIIGIKAFDNFVLGAEMKETTGLTGLFGLCSFIKEYSFSTCGFIVINSNLGVFLKRMVKWFVVSMMIVWKFRVRSLTVFWNLSGLKNSLVLFMLSGFGMAITLILYFWRFISNKNSYMWAEFHSLNVYVQVLKMNHVVDDQKLQHQKSLSK